MFSFGGVVVIGFLLGMRHALDPDHVIAVTTIVSRQGGVARGALIGSMWGLGHTFTIFIVGSVIILFGVNIPPRLGLLMELAVAAMLMLLGVLNLSGFLQRLQNKSTPHLDEQPTLPVQRRFSRGLGLYNLLRPLAVGIVHGLAGSAAIALLVMTTIRQPWWAIAYLLLFGAGTIAGMMVVTTALSTSFLHTARRFSSWNRRMTMASGLLSLALGFFVAYQVGFVDGLFTDHPRWTPQ
jgi:ABC-type nickel/cobalt efflux system permease component RcnA